MALENMFIAGGIITTAAMGVFLYLFHMAEGKIWKMVWLNAIFLVMIFSFHMLELGFDDIIVHNDLAAATTSFLKVLIYVFYASFAWMFLRMVLMLLNHLVAAAQGKDPKGDDDG